MGENTVVAKPGEAKVVLGTSVRIPLVAVRPNIADKVTFRITVQPKFGTLSEIRPDPSDIGRAWVVYTPKPDSRPGADSFKFNAKLTGEAAAPSSTIDLQLEEPAAVLKVEAALAFGRVEVGMPATRPLTIRNVGTAIFTTMLQPPAPWSIPEAQRRLVVEPGRSVVVDVVFLPAELKRVSFLLLLQPSNPEGNVELSGTGSAPFIRQLGSLDLGWDEASGERSGTVRIENLTRRTLPLKLTAAAPLQVQPGVILDPGQALEVPVGISGIAAFRGDLTIASQHHEDTITVTAKATPARIEVLKPQAQRFESVLLDTDEPPVHEVVLINVGGQSAVVYGQTSRPFSVVEGGDPAELASGEQMTVKVTLDRKNIGTFDRALNILGTANKIKFQLSAQVSRETSREAVGVSLPGLPPLIDPGDSRFYNVLPDRETRIHGVNDKNRVIKPEIPTVEQIYLEKQTQRKLVFSWDHPGSPDNQYILEIEVHDKGEPGTFPRAVWYAATEHVKVEKDAKGARMTLSKLQPGRSFRMRIVTMNNVGHYSEPSRSELVYTLPAGRKKLWLWLPLCAVLGGGGFYVWWRRQQI